MSARAELEQFDPLIQEVEEMQVEFTLEPHRKLEIWREHIRKAKDAGGQRKAHLLTTFFAICNERNGMEKGNYYITVSGGQVGVLNLGDVTGNITATVSALAAQGDKQSEVAQAIKDLAQSIANSDLATKEKKEALDAVNSIATEANAPPEKRNASGVLKAIILGFPALLSTAKDALELWGKYEPVIRAHLGF